jgi:CMP-N-acetylneuraminic acid synthetase
LKVIINEVVMKPKIVALVPMRHHSQRVPEKNYRLLAGKPLFHHILETLLTCPKIDQVVVDTDSPVITSGITDHYPAVMVLERPESLRADAVPMNDILLYDTSRIEADFYLQTHSTNPLLRAETISNAIKSLLDHYPEYDSLFSVTPWKKRFWDISGLPMNHDPNVLLQTQDLPPIYEENSCIYLFTRQTLVERRNRLGEHPYLFPIKPDEAWDIDEELDFFIVEQILKGRR